MKYKIYIAIFGIIFFLSYALYRLYNNYQEHKEQIDILRNNYQALQKERDTLINNSRVFKLTIESLNDKNDSISNILSNTYKKLKIKDREVKSLSYIKSKISKRDTIIIRDTIFKPEIDIDTLITDEWYNLHLRLKYPDTLAIEPTFISKKVLVFSYKKVYLKKPKNWFCALFTRKSKVVEVDVKDLNPYVSELDNKFIDIVE